MEGIEQALVTQRFNLCDAQWTYKAFGNSACIRLDAPRYFPDTFPAPSYPCPLHLPRSKPKDLSLDLMAVAIVSPEVPFGKSINSKIPLEYVQFCRRTVKRLAFALYCSHLLLHVLKSKKNSAFLYFC